uniref:hypothetical protein n=1 Tax=uncultured Erythrobacter sp. TaxID=263913 RepID=UPI002623BD47|nr:hypothetical protein [uncultured Erythrobacter sp.]
MPVLAADHPDVDQSLHVARLAHRRYDRCCNFADQRLYHADGGLRQIVTMWIAVIVIFVLGIGNFALHRAVLDSEHPMLDAMPAFIHMMGGKLTLVAEFLVLMVAMLLAANGWPEMVWGYVAYSALNGGAAWLILSGKA